MTTVTGLNLLQEFDVVDFTNFSENSDVEGRAVIGGSITSSNSSTFYTKPNGALGVAPPAWSYSMPALTVYGAINQSLNINNGGSVYYGSLGSGKTINYNGGGSHVTSVPLTMSTIQSAAMSLETQLAALTTNSTVNASDANNVTFNASGTTAVFSISASALKTWHGLTLNIGSATSVIINVTGATTLDLSSIGLNLNSGFTSNQQKIIWNFETATSLKVAGWQGAIVAVDAAFTNTSAVNGAVIANSIAAQGEIHEYAYTGVVCFLSGTMIATPAGETAIEDLAIGDMVLTSDGAAAPIRWIGRRTISRAFADPVRGLPVRIRAGALGEATPARDLLVSNCHAMLVGDVLVQAGAMVNGTSIVRETETADTFTYYHVELDDHALILAEGAPTETFVDNADRMRFDNWAEHEALYPEGREVPEISLRRVQSARQMPMSIRRLLDGRALALGYAVAAAA
jgi:choice-of-anchor A domain-containing protein